MAAPKTAVIATLIALALSASVGVCWAKGSSRANRDSFTGVPSGRSIPVPSELAFVNSQRRLIGQGAQAFWLFTPTTPSSRPAPVVFFLHGWMAMDPYFYGGWIDHLVSQGSIVVYPVFQTSKSDTPDSMRRNAIVALQQAVDTLNAPNRSVRPDWRRLSIIGHSFGGGLSTLVASSSRAAGLPTPRFVLALAPGWRGGPLPSQDLAQFPASTYLMLVEGSNDELAGSRQTTVIYSSTAQLSARNKHLLVLRTSNNIPVNHSSPLSPLESYRNPALSESEVRRQRIATFLFNKMFGQDGGTIDFVDYNGYWRLFDNANEALDRGESPFLAIPSTVRKVSGDGTIMNPRRGVVEP